MPPRQRPQGPTLNEIRQWPAMVAVEHAAWALRISRAYAYRLLQQGEFPVRTRLVGAKRAVVTGSLIAYIEGKAEDSLAGTRPYPPGLPQGTGQHRGTTPDFGQRGPMPGATRR